MGDRRPSRAPNLADSEGAMEGEDAKDAFYRRGAETRRVLRGLAL